LNHSSLEVLGTATDLMAVLEDEDRVRELKPNFTLLMQIERRGTIVSALGDGYDFISRFFAPHIGIPKDPVTGSAHFVLIPYWAKRSSKKTTACPAGFREGWQAIL
jgi:predicted PhzF superfamily epimerase YddE/YHI9